MFNVPVRALAFALACPLVLGFLARGCGRQPRNDNQAHEVGGTVNSAQVGTWGGEHISLEVTAQGGRVEYDCGHGTIDQKLVTDRAGRFDLRGTHVREHGGPVRIDEKEDSHPARYNGEIKGDTMTLTVTESDTGQAVGTFTLVFGRQARLMKCR